jgi:hypothetical protein
MTSLRKKVKNIDQDLLDHFILAFILKASTFPNNPQPSMAITSFPTPTSEDTEELLLIARYGELDELKSFIEKFGSKPLTDARDQDGNTILHMVCGNGHLGTTHTDSKARVVCYSQCSFTD